MNDYNKKQDSGNKQKVHEDKTSYDKLSHKKSDARSAGIGYDQLQNAVKKL